MRLFLSIICSFLTFSSISATNVTQIIKVINGKRFIVEKDDSYALNEDYLLVKLKNGLDIPTGMKIINSNKLGYLHVAVPDNIDVEDYSKYLKETNQFEIVEYIGEIKYNLSPNDSYISNQWYINAVNLKDAWNITTGNSNIKVAVIDSGVEASHYDLGNGTDSYSNISTSMGYDYINHTTINFPSFFHGTFVAGLIGAKTNNSLGISGVSGGNHSQGITIIPYNMGGSDNEGDAPLFSLYLANAILDAISLGVNIINLSLSTSQTSDIASAIEYAYYHNINIVCAAGNNNSSSISYPASSQYTIAVGASGHNNHRCSFSNYGNGLDLVAPGKDIYSTSLSNSYVYKDGTSFSTAMVSGVIALMLSVNPNLTPSEVKNILHSTSAQIEGYSFNNGWNQQVGYGLLNAHAAVKQAFQIDITGPSIMCSQELFSISGMPINDNNVILNSHSSTGISIEVSSNLNIISYSHGILNVQKVENGQGYIAVYYKGNLISLKIFWVGEPIITGLSLDGRTLHINTVSSSFIYDDSYTLRINGEEYMIWGGLGSIPDNLTDGYYYAEVFCSNDCGESNHYSTLIHLGGVGDTSYQASFKPILGIITITRLHNEHQTLFDSGEVYEKQEIVPYTIINTENGRCTSTGVIPHSGGTINISNLKKGCYILTIKPKGEKEETFKFVL